MATKQLTSKQASFVDRLIGWITEKDAIEGARWDERLQTGAYDHRTLIDELIACNDGLRKQERQAERKQAAAAKQATTPSTVVFDAKILDDEFDHFGTHKLIVDGSAIGVARVSVTFSTKLRDSHGEAIRVARMKDHEVVVTVAGKVTFLSGSFAKVTKAKGHELVTMASELPTDEQFNQAKRAWKELMTTEVVGERKVRCCSHDHSGYCYASVQVMSDIWESCGCGVKPGFQETTVVAVDHVHAPLPAPAELVAWFEALTPVEQRLGDSGRNQGYGMGSDVSTVHWALASLARPESDHNDHERAWKQLAYVGH